MQNKWLVVFGSVAILFLFACKKQDIVWDKEANLATDTSLYLKSVTYVSHSDDEVLLNVEIVRFNNLEPEQNYLNTPIKPYYENDYTYSFEDIEVVNHTPITQYTSVFLFEKSGYSLYREGEASFFLRRYFEFIETQGANKKIAVATFLSDYESQFTFHTENSSLFDNSAAYNDSILVDLIKNTNKIGGYAEDGEIFKNLMLEIIDTLSMNTEVLGQKSITVFDDAENNGIFNYSNAAIDTIIARAIDNDVMINVVNLRGVQYARMALATGGFVIDSRDENRIKQTLMNNPVSSIGNNLANLDRILSNNVTAHKFTISLSYVHGDAFFSGWFLSPSIVYDEINKFSFDLVLP